MMASASISTRQRGSSSPATTTMVAAGRTSANTAPCARPTASASNRSVMNILVRTTSPGPAPSSESAVRIISRHRCAWTSASGAQLPSGQIGAVPETTTRWSARTARLKPIEDSNGEPDLTRWRSLAMSQSCPRLTGSWATHCSCGAGLPITAMSSTPLTGVTPAPAARTPPPRGGAGFSLHLVESAARNCYRVLGRAGSRQRATPTGATPA